MDSRIKQSIEQLEKKKQRVNADSNLQDECESLIELDKRVGALLGEIQSLHVDVDHRYEFIEGNLCQLGGSNKVLQRTSDALDLSIELTKLNRICRRIETNPNLIKCPESGQVTVRLKANMDDANSIDESDLDYSDKLVLSVIRQIFSDFETIYRPLEYLLSRRLDLPYVGYATKVRNLKELLARLGIAI